MERWITADLHLGHANIAGLGSPFNRSGHKIWGWFAKHADGRLSYERLIKT